MLRSAGADLRSDIDDDQLPHRVGPRRCEVHRVAAAHREADHHQRGDTELIDHAAQIVEGRSLRKSLKFKNLAAISIRTTLVSGRRIAWHLTCNGGAMNSTTSAT